MRISILFLVCLLVSCARYPTTSAGIGAVLCLRDTDDLSVGPAQPLACCVAFPALGSMFTAAHCLGDEREAWLVSDTQWQHTANDRFQAHVTRLWWDRDLVELSPMIGPGLVPGALPAPGESIEALTRSGGKSGRVLEYSGMFGISSIAVSQGDSGAPVLHGGRVIGAIVACEAAGQCRGDTGIFAILPLRLGDNHAP